MPGASIARTMRVHANRHDSGRTRNFVFLLVPGFSMMTLAAALEPLRALNRLVGFQAYDWRLASLHGETVATSSGIPLPALTFEDSLVDVDYLIVCAGFIRKIDEQRYLGAIRH